MRFPLYSSRIIIAGGYPKTQIAKHSTQENTAYTDLINLFAYISHHIDEFSDSLAGYIGVVIAIFQPICVISMRNNPKTVAKRSNASEMCSQLLSE